MAILAGTKLYTQLLKVLSLIAKIHCGLLIISRVGVAELSYNPARLVIKATGASATRGSV